MSGSQDSPRAAAPAPRRGSETSRDSLLLVAGSALNGVLAYAFFVLASRSLGAEGAAPVSVLWSYWALAGAVLTFPVQHWMIRSFTRDGHEATVARTMPRLCAVVTVAALAAGVAAFGFRQDLFDDGTLVYPALVTGVTLGSFLMGLVRGALSGRGRFAATAASLVAENGLRVVVAGAVIWMDGGAQAFGVALVAGPLIGLVWAPSLRLGASPSGVVVGRDSLSLVSGVAGGSLIGQVVLTATPVVLAIVGGAPAQVTSLFLALSVWRAPYLVAMGVTPQLTSVLTRLALDGPARRVARASRTTALAVLGAAVVAVAIGMTVLQPVLQAMFGADVEMRPGELAGLGVGTAAAIGNLVLLLILLALGRSRVTTVAWVVSVAGAAVWMAVAEVPPAPRVVVAFVLAEVMAFALLMVAVERAVATAARATPSHGGR